MSPPAPRSGDSRKPNNILLRVLQRHHQQEIVFQVPGEEEILFYV